jgi:hypothetical protein
MKQNAAFPTPRSSRSTPAGGRQTITNNGLTIRRCRASPVPPSGVGGTVETFVKTWPPPSPPNDPQFTTGSARAATPSASRRRHCRAPTTPWCELAAQRPLHRRVFSAGFANLPTERRRRQLRCRPDQRPHREHAYGLHFDVDGLPELVNVGSIEILVSPSAPPT